jgi:alpha/beta superfamily hydrolase
MDNNVVHRTARGLYDAGLAVVRFNFRGTGASEGTHDGQGGEEEDLRAAVDWLAARYPGVDLWAAGFSFGARTVAGLAPKEPRIARVVLVALPVLAYDCTFALKIQQPGAIFMAGEASVAPRSNGRRPPGPPSSARPGACSPSTGSPRWAPRPSSGRPG